MRAEDQTRVRQEVPRRVVARYRAQASAADDEDFASAVVNETLYQERERLRRSRRPSARAEKRYYDKLHAALLDKPIDAHFGLVEQLAERFVGNIVGPSSARVYQVATKVAPLALGALLNIGSPRKLLSFDSMAAGLSGLLDIQGDVATLRALAQRGTVVVVPNHTSNLDPMIMGYALSLSGLPRFQFGGKAELFFHPAASYFLHTLGAYRVDRRKTARLYKDVLKEYVTLSLQLGYPNIFFPGGTRSRSGALERRLKKGLLGTAVTAMTRDLQQRGASARPVFVVPCTISYKLVLEAETLIDRHLSDEGRGAYIIEDDEFAQPARVLSFLRELVARDIKIRVEVGTPLDVVGNRVDASGQSFDGHGRAVDASRYVYVDGEPVVDEQRDREYTDELARVISATYQRDNALMSTHVVAAALLALLRERSPELSIYRLLQTGGDTSSLPLDEVARATDDIIARVARLPDGPRLGGDVVGAPADRVLDDALTHYGIYHRRPAARRRGDRVFPENRNLIAYYANRVAPYWHAGALERYEAPTV